MNSIAIATLEPLDAADGPAFSTLRAGQIARNAASHGFCDGTASKCAALLAFRAIWLRGGGVLVNRSG